MNPKTTLPLTLTGNNDLDRGNVFNYILDNFNSDQTESEIIVLAASFLSKNTKEILTEIKLNPDVLVPVCLYIMKEEKIHILRRVDIGSALSKYADMQGKIFNEKATKTPLFNFTNEYEEALYAKLANVSPKEIKVSFPFFNIYYHYGRIFESMNDMNNALRNFSKAHNWNPINPKAVVKLLESLKYEKRAFDLYRLSHWYLQVVYSLPHISAALRYHGYALYLNGKFEEAYACYYSSVIYDDSLPPHFNEEVTSILKALGKDTPYELTKTAIKKLFAYTKEKPYPSEFVLDTLRGLIIEHYNKNDYAEVLRYATSYILLRPNDQKIMRIFNVSKINLD